MHRRNNMPIYSYTPSSEFNGRVNALFNSMLQQFVTSGQILPHVQTALINMFNQDFPTIINAILGKLPSGTVPSDQQLQPLITSIIHQMLQRYNQAQQRAMYTPQYQYGNGVVVQPQAYNPMLATGGMPTTSLFTGNVTPPAAPQGAFYTNPGIVTPPAQQQPAVNSGIVTPPSQAPAQTQVSHEEQRQALKELRDLATNSSVGDYSYRPPVVTREHGNHIVVTMELGWGDAEITSYQDPETNEQIDCVKVDTDRGFVTPLDAAFAAVNAMRGSLSVEKYVSVEYNQIQAYDVPRSVSDQVLTKLKQMAKNAPHNSKYAYLQQMEDILGSINKSPSDKLEYIFVLEFNRAAMHGALFSSDMDPSQGSFKINSLKELRDYLELDRTVDTNVEKLRSQVGFRDRLNTVARNTILRAAQEITLSDPNTPEGLADYIEIYGDYRVEGHPIKEIVKFREIALRTDSEGEKTQQAIDAMNIYTKMIDTLLKYSVVRMGRQNAVYTTLPLNGMLMPGFLVKCEPQDLGGPGEPTSHCEYFLTQLGNGTQRPFTMFFQPSSNILISCVGVSTSDGWIRFMPTRMLP